MTAPPDPQRPKPGFARKVPFLVILAVAVLGTVALRDQLSFAALAGHRTTLLAFRDAHYLWAVLAFMAAYVGIVAFSLPGGTVATLTGGFLFGVFPGVVFNVVAGTVGAIAVFLAARAGFGEQLSRRVTEGGGKVGRLVEGLRQNEWSVLLLMRLVPVLPFFLANLVPAFTGTRTMVFAVTTFFGIIPGSLVFTSVGAGLSDVFARGETPDLGVLFTAPVLLPILGLAALAALPMLIRLVRKGFAP